MLNRLFDHADTGFCSSDALRQLAYSTRAFRAISGRPDRVALCSTTVLFRSVDSAHYKPARLWVVAPAVFL